MHPGTPKNNDGYFVGYDPGFQLKWWQKILSYFKIKKYYTEVTTSIIFEKKGDKYRIVDVKTSYK